MAIDTKPSSDDKSLATFKEIRDIAARYPTERFHLLLPTTYMELSPLFIPSPVPVVVNPGDEREVYVKPGSSKDAQDPEFCFHGQKLQEIANAGGLDFDPSLTRHRHDRKSEPWVCEQIAAGWYIDSLGQRRLISSDWVTHDLRDGAPRSNLITRQGPKALEVARQFICEQCGTRARSRAIRKTMNLKSSYRRSELVWLDQVDGKTVVRPKPFVAIRFRLNDADEDVKRAIIARGIGAGREVYGQAAATAELSERGSGADQLEDIEGEIVEQAEPPVPDDMPAAAKPAPADIPTLIAPIVAAAAHAPDQSPAAKDLVANLGVALRDALGLKGRLGGQAMADVRLAIAKLVFGPALKSALGLTAGQARALVDLTKEPAGQDVLKALFAHVLEHDAALEAAKAELAKAAA